MMGVGLRQALAARMEIDLLAHRASRVCPPDVLALAVESLRGKAFHSIGGSIYAGWPAVPRRQRRRLTATIVALQVMSDYLDTLVDRSGCQDQRVHGRLHRAFVDALDPWGPAMPAGQRGEGYFEGFPLGCDGGYLELLAERVREGVKALPGYHVVSGRVSLLARLYCEMQVIKHAPPGERERGMIAWHRARRGLAPEGDALRWWEFAAAAGSTLGIFGLLALAADPAADVGEAERLMHAYFPYTCAVHIMLDYLIDRDEDRLHGEMNFTNYYGSAETAACRIEALFGAAQRRLQALAGARFHLEVLRGLPAIYLSDPKVASSGLEACARVLLARAGPEAAWFYAGCRLLRAVGVL